MRDTIVIFLSGIFIVAVKLLSDATVIFKSTETKKKSLVVKLSYIHVLNRSKS